MREQHPQPNPHESQGPEKDPMASFDALGSELTQKWDKVVGIAGTGSRGLPYSIEAEKAAEAKSIQNRQARLVAHVAEEHANGRPVELSELSGLGRHRKEEEFALVAQHTGPRRDHRNEEPQQPKSADDKPTTITVPRRPRDDNDFDVTLPDAASLPGGIPSGTRSVPVRLNGPLPISSRVTPAEAPDETGSQGTVEASTEQRQRFVGTPGGSINPAVFPEGIVGERVIAQRRNIEDTVLDDGTPEVPAKTEPPVEERPSAPDNEEPAFPFVDESSEARPTRYTIAPLSGAPRVADGSGRATNGRRHTTHGGRVVEPVHRGRAPVEPYEGDIVLPLPLPPRYRDDQEPSSPEGALPLSAHRVEATPPLTQDERMKALGISVVEAGDPGKEGDLYRTTQWDDGSPRRVILGTANREGVNEILELETVRAEGAKNNPPYTNEGERAAIDAIPVDQFDRILQGIVANAGASYENDRLTIGSASIGVPVEVSNSDQLIAVRRAIRLLHKPATPLLPEPEAVPADGSDGDGAPVDSSLYPPRPTRAPDSAPLLGGRHRGHSRVRGSFERNKRKIVKSGAILLAGAAAITGALFLGASTNDSNESPSEHQAPAVSGTPTPGQPTEASTKAPEETRSAVVPIAPSATTAPAAPAPTETNTPVPAIPPKPTTPPAVPAQPGTTTPATPPAQPATPKVEVPKPVENRLDKVSFIPKEAGSIAAEVEVKKGGTASEAILDAIKAAEAAKLMTPQSSNLATTYSIINDLRNRGVDVDNIVEGQTYEIVLNDQGNITSVTS